MKKQNGHTLMELVFVIVLLSFSLPGLLAFFTNTVVDSIKNEVICKAIILAQGKMEEIVADKQNKDKGISFIKALGNYPMETFGHYVRTTTIRDKVIRGVSGLDVSVSISHSLLQNDYTLTHFFTKQDIH